MKVVGLAKDGVSSTLRSISKCFRGLLSHFLVESCKLGLPEPLKNKLRWPALVVTLRAIELVLEGICYLESGNLSESGLKVPILESLVLTMDISCFYVDLLCFSSERTAWLVFVGDGLMGEKP